VAFGIEEQILWLDVTVCNALAVKVGYSIQHLLETALDFARAHSTARKSKVSIRFKSKVRCQSRQDHRQPGIIGWKTVVMRNKG
jgi:hypothetical protein